MASTVKEMDEMCLSMIWFRMSEKERQEIIRQIELRRAVEKVRETLPGLGATDAVSH